MSVWQYERETDRWTDGQTIVKYSVFDGVAMLSFSVCSCDAINTTPGRPYTAEQHDAL